MKTKELTGRALDYAVARIESEYFREHCSAREFAVMWGDDADLQFSTNWSQAGPIIEREGIGIGKSGYGWLAALDPDEGKSIDTDGLTPLVAAMRAFVVARLGPEIEIPKELV